MHLHFQTPKQSLNKAYQKEKVTRKDIEIFKKNLSEFLANVNEKESEEHAKNLVTKFLYDTYYNGKNQINTKGRIDLAIYEDKKPVVILEAKRPSSTDMVTRKDINRKAIHELLLYYLQERVDHGNIDIKYLIITNSYEWFIFDSSVFDSLFYRNTSLMKDFIEWKNGQKARPDRDLFYNDIAKPFLTNLQDKIEFTWFDLHEVHKIVTDPDTKNDNKLINLYKILSPAHLLKQPFANDSNSLDTKFYAELLHIIGLEEKKDGGKKLIQRKEKPDQASLLENAINILKTEDRLYKLSGNGSAFGENEDERLFNVGLELCITWINRILFLKLLEGQLLTYHSGDDHYKFLNFKTIPNFDELNKLFFQVLARKPEERTNAVRVKFERVPYLNSSLFDISSLEDDTLRINSLDDGLKIQLHKSTVLKTDNGKKREGELPTLQYLFEFLDAYDFSSEGNEEIQEENKVLINASVLGLIFEKINGYKDGSFFTPGFITMYMCRETIRRAVVQKFNEAKGWKLESFDQLHNEIKDINEANSIINSLKICDPAVGSGHFLVSALNEILAIKSELHVLSDRYGKLLRDYAIEVVNDEIIVSTGDHEFFEYRPSNKESQRVQEALFHEKQTIIENCLFGVDINPNSVKICRLRLWIELLKNAYYTDKSKFKELETLPNIDINIKQGNSLISRFPLDADLSKALKSIKYNIDDYKSFVAKYKNATDKEEKRGFEKLIEQIKGDFRTEIAKYSDPDKKRLQGLTEEIFRKYQSGQLYDQKLSDKQQKDRNKLEDDINKLTSKIQSKISDPIFKGAFEWRFEFPEVLDKEGRFIGFDAVIGNPPYGVSLNKMNGVKYQESYSTFSLRGESYSLFLERVIVLLKPYGSFSFIIPDTILNLAFTEKIRQYILQHTIVHEIDLLPASVFVDATVDTILLFFSKNFLTNGFNKSSVKINLYDKRTQLENLDKSNNSFVLSTESWYAQKTFNIQSNQLDVNVIQRIESVNPKVRDFADIFSGIKVYEVGKGNPPQTEKIRDSKPYTSTKQEKVNWSPFYDGKDIGYYKLLWNKNNWIDYGPWLAAPRLPENFIGEKILIRKIVGKRLIAHYIQETCYCNTLLFVLKLKPALAKLSYKSLLGIINSNFIGWYFRKKFQISDEDTFPQIMIRDILEFAIPNIKNKTTITIEKLVDEILKAKMKNSDADTAVLEKEIDQLVYELYGLTKEEIKIVEAKSIATQQ